MINLLQSDIYGILKIRALFITPAKILLLTNNYQNSEGNAHLSNIYHQSHANAINGIQIWVLCDSFTHFAWNLQVHTGKTRPDSAAEENQGQSVVLDLVHDLKSRNVACNN